MRLNDIDFDRPFEVHADGSVSFPSDVWAPEVFNSESDDVDVYATPGQRWEPLTGYTGQHGYAGGVMHASEQMGGALERDVLAVPGVYVMTVVNCVDDDEPAGWAVLRLSR